MIRVTDEEKKIILESHRVAFEKQVMIQKTDNLTPLEEEDLATDKKGITVDGKGDVKEYTNVVSEQDGKGCADTEAGCIRKKDGGWVVMNNKKGGVWRKCDSKKHCEEMLDAFHANQ